MKTKAESAFTFVIALLSAFCIGDARPVLAEPLGQGVAETNVYGFCKWRLQDSPKTPYQGYYRDKHVLYELGLTTPAAAELPAARDTGGNWGPPGDNLQLSVRFHRHEFLVGEPVEAMIIIRNLDSAPRPIMTKAAFGVDFEYVVRHGTNTFTWAEPEETRPHSDIFPRYKGGWLNMGGYSQAAEFVRLGRLFKLSLPGDYTLRVRRPTALRNGQGMTNLLSGTAKFRIVEKLSPAEIAATNAFAEELKLLDQKVMGEKSKALEEKRGATSAGLKRLRVGRKDAGNAMQGSSGRAEAGATSSERNYDDAEVDRGSIADEILDVPKPSALLAPVQRLICFMADTTILGTRSCDLCLGLSQDAIFPGSR